MQLTESTALGSRSTKRRKESHVEKPKQSYLVISCKKKKKVLKFTLLALGVCWFSEKARALTQDSYHA